MASTDTGLVDADLTDAVRLVGAHAGLDAVGVARAEPFLSTKRDLLERRDAGLHGGMAFTYRNPARSTDPAATLPGATSLVVGARGYLRREDDDKRSAGPFGRVARYAWTDVYAPLRAGLSAVADRLRTAGYRARVVADDNALVDREAAVRAGLGWYGKNANVLLGGLGSWFVLGSVITDAPLEAAGEGPAHGCGCCIRCLRACPTGAIVSPGVVDARRCLAWIVQAPGVIPRQFREALGDRIYGCDDCQEACPLNRRVDEPPRAEPGARARIPILDLLALDDENLLAVAPHWYVAQRDPRYLRRNALVVLGNTGDGRSSAVLAAVGAALEHPDPLVRAHAVWAAARLGRPELADVLALTEADAMVRVELDARSSVVAARPVKRQ